MKQIKENNLEVIEFIHYIDDKKYNEVLEKYKVGMKVKTYIEKHIFILSNKSNDLLSNDFYSEFSIKFEDTFLNITNNLLNDKYQHTDETVTRENGKDSYYRDYANKYNVLYKYHNHK